MQARLLGINAEGLLVFADRFVPTVALEQQVAEKTVPPCRLAIQMCATIRQAGGKIQVLVAKLEPSFALIRIERCELAELVCRISEVFLTQIGRSQRLARLTVRRIQLQRALKKRPCFLGRA